MLDGVVLLQAQVLAKLGQSEKSIELLTKLAQTNPLRVEPLRHLGAIHASRGELQQVMCPGLEYYFNVNFLLISISHPLLVLCSRSVSHLVIQVCPDSNIFEKRLIAMS